MILPLSLTLFFRTRNTVVFKLIKVVDGNLKSKFSNINQSLLTVYNLFKLL